MGERPAGAVDGARLRQSREAKGLTQEGLARLVRVHSSTVERIEQGPPKTIRTGTLARLCDVLGVSTDYLLGRSRGPSSSEADREAEIEAPLLVIAVEG